jgi:thiamine transport system permease protein
MALVQVAATLLMTLIYTRIQARGAAPLERRAEGSLERPARTWRARLLVGGSVAALLLLVGAPLLALALRSLSSLGPGEAGGLTLEHYRALGESRRGALFAVPPARAVLNSLGFALVATAIAMLIGTPAAYLLAMQNAKSKMQHRGRGGGRGILHFAFFILDPLFTLPLGVSAVTLGLGYIVALGPLGLLRSPWLIPAAHTLLAFPFVVRSLLPALRALDPRLRDAARVLGAGSAQVLRAVDLPLLFPALLVGAVFSFTVSLGDFGAALLLARPELPTAPVVIARLLGQPGAANYGQALALSTILMAVAAAGFLALERLRFRDIGEF